MATFLQLSEDEPAVDFASLVAAVNHPDDEAAAEKKRKALVALVDEYMYKRLLQEGLFGEDVLGKVLAQHPNDVDTVFNLAFALIDQLALEDTAELVPSFVDALTRTNSHARLMLKLLNTLFNVLDQATLKRHVVFAALLRYALDNGQQATLAGQFRHLDAWLKQWPVTREERAEILFLAFNVARLNRAGKEEQELMLKYFRALEGADAAALSKARPYAAAAALAAIKGNAASECDMLLGLAAVAQLEGDKEHADTHALLRVVAHGQVADYEAFAASKAGFLGEAGVDGERLASKMRTLTLCTLGKGGRVLSYDELGEALRVKGDGAVEEAVIEAVVSGHVDAKIDQARRSVHVQRATMRTNEQGQWKELLQKLDSWHGSVGSVLTTVIEARNPSV